MSQPYKRTATFVMLLAISAAWGIKPADGQVLQEFGNEVHGSPTASPATLQAPTSQPATNTARREQGTLATEHDDNNGVKDALGKLVLIAGTAAVAAPFILPRAILNDEGQSAVYPDYPYDHNGTIAAVCYDETVAGTHHSLIVLQAAYGSNLDDVNQFQGRIFGDLDLRLGFDAETSYFTENVPTGTDEFWRGDANLTWRFAQNEHWQFRAGIGVNWVHDRRGAEAGINGTYNIEWFPKDPWVLSSSLDAGSVGSSGLLHTRNTIGITHNGWGFFTGHDYLKLDSTSLHTWITGVEYRF